MIRMLKKYLKKIIPDKIFTKIMFEKRMGYKLDLKNPQTFAEKLNWLKLYNRKDEYTHMVDKITGRYHANKKVEYIRPIPLYGVYDKYEDIDFNKLPNKYIIKTNHGSGDFLKSKDNKIINLKENTKKFNHLIKNNYYYYMREWPYKNVKPKIIIEELLEEDISGELKDYKFYCFDGVVKFLIVAHGKDKFENGKYYIDSYDINFNKMNIKHKNFESSNIKLNKPVNFSKMIEAAKILSKDHPFLRVDFYNVNGEIYFGEYTFYDFAGMSEFIPESFNYELGRLIEINSGDIR